MSVKKLKEAVKLAETKEDEAKQFLDEAIKSGTDEEKAQAANEHKDAVKAVEDAKADLTNFEAEAAAKKEGNKAPKNAASKSNAKADKKDDGAGKVSFKGGVEITSKSDGFRRCGVAHSTTATKHPKDAFTDEQIAVMDADPNLVVVPL